MEKCDFCGMEAKYDCKTIYGPWAYVCENCFSWYAVKHKDFYTFLKEDSNNENK